MLFVSADKRMLRRVGLYNSSVRTVRGSNFWLMDRYLNYFV